MKNNFSFFLLLLVACNSKNQKARDFPEIVFKKDTFDFNIIKKKDSVNANFIYSNTGKSDLIIKNMIVGCGCTTITSYQDTIAPNESGNINILYHSNDDTSNVLKTIVVETNCKPKLHVLYIKGVVE